MFISMVRTSCLLYVFNCILYQLQFSFIFIIVIIIVIKFDIYFWLSEDGADGSLLEADGSDGDIYVGHNKTNHDYDVRSTSKKQKQIDNTTSAESSSLLRLNTLLSLPHHADSLLKDIDSNTQIEEGKKGKKRKTAMQQEAMQQDLNSQLYSVQSLTKQEQVERLEKEGYFISPIFSEQKTAEFLKDLLGVNVDIAKNLTTLQRSYRFKFDLARPLNWDTDYEVHIKNSFPSLFEGANKSAKITKLTMLLSLPDGNMQDCHVDSG